MITNLLHPFKLSSTNLKVTCSLPFSLKKYVQEKEKKSSMILLSQRFQINLTREVELCKMIAEGKEVITKRDITELWEKIDLFGERDESFYNETTSFSLNNSSSNIIQDEDDKDDMRKLSQRLTFYASHFKNNDGQKSRGFEPSRFSDNLNSTNEVIGLDLFYTENELNEMRRYPIYVNDKRIHKMFDISDVIIENGKIIKGKIRGIVNIGAIHKNNEVMQTLIWTNDLYSNNCELLKCITDCFEVSCLGDNVECQIVRSRVVGSLKYWIESCLFDNKFLEDIKVFIQRLKKYGMNNQSNTLDITLSRRLVGMEKEYSRDDTIKKHVFIPPSLYYDIDTPLEMMSPKEVARQLTLKGYSLFSKVKVNELLSWNEQDKESQCKSILAITQFSNRVVELFVNFILSAKNLKHRIQILEFVCQIGIEAEELHNYDLLCCISFTFNKSAIYRLKRTFNRINEKYQQFIVRLKKVSSPENNWQTLRNCTTQDENVIHALPYLGYFLSDVTFINDGNVSTFGNGVINYLKCNMLMSVAQKIYHLQQIPYYDLVESVPMQEALEKLLESIPTMLESQIDKKQYLLSKLIEPSVKHCIFPIKDGKFFFLSPLQMTPKPYNQDPSMDVNTFLSCLLPTIFPFVSFVAVLQNSFIGFSGNTSLSLLIPANYYTIYLKPVEVTIFIYTEDGWLKTKILLDSSRPLMYQMNAFLAISIDKNPFILFHMKQGIEDHLFLDVNVSLSQNNFEINDYIISYPLTLLKSCSFGYSADVVLFDEEKNYYTATLSIVSPIIVERGIDGALKEVGIPVLVVIAGMVMYVYKSDNLIRIFPIQFTRTKIYPGTRGVVLILTINNNTFSNELTESLFLIGDQKLIFDIVERVDVLTCQYSKCIMGISLNITLTRENRKIPYLIDKLISSITLDPNFFNPTTFDFIDFSIANLAHTIDGHSNYSFNSLSLQQRVSLLRCFLASLPEPLIPESLYDDFSRVSKFPEMKQCGFINEKLQLIETSSSMLSSVLYLLHLYLSYNPSKFDKLIPFVPILLRKGDSISPLDQITVKILLTNVPHLHLPISQLHPIQFIPKVYSIKIKMPDYPAMNQLIGELNDTTKQALVNKKYKTVICKIKQPEQSCNENDIYKLLSPDIKQYHYDEKDHKGETNVVNFETFLLETKKEKSKTKSWLNYSSSRSMSNSPILPTSERPTSFLGASRKRKITNIKQLDILSAPSTSDSTPQTPSSNRSSQEEIVGYDSTLKNSGRSRKSPRTNRGGTIVLTASGWTTAEVQPPKYSSFLLETENQ
ncbi:guanine nucleotide exchange factor, putative [Entamoeba dispar SAW760]|uniref:Guanine nucleotide exchange factor, putative n=1 Tax=Entamoeba dispar (strain ATCC PRA-260 / SAW760) TaxID=370354 RepID=B0E979_ENTDS|nr:guanine nucleotide exchange factor, putative [Entamoeba dispar SAW760]EDR28908.1 guanine nucleotide exchange factor, putative [Entamoeba dispar SAW760]|eukprot:EDR28908.1 guanine nucleotide exchange factor, putative [Entamoeba dispar SAW760]